MNYKQIKAWAQAEQAADTQREQRFQELAASATARIEAIEEGDRQMAQFLNRLADALPQ